MIIHQHFRPAVRQLISTFPPTMKSPDRSFVLRSLLMGLRFTSSSKIGPIPVLVPVRHTVQASLSPLCNSVNEMILNPLHLSHRLFCDPLQDCHFWFSAPLQGQSSYKSALVSVSLLLEAVFCRNEIP